MRGPLTIPWFWICCLFNAFYFFLSFSWKLVWWDRWRERTYQMEEQSLKAEQRWRNKTWKQNQDPYHHPKKTTTLKNKWRKKKSWPWTLPKCQEAFLWGWAPQRLLCAFCRHHQGSVACGQANWLVHLSWNGDMTRPWTGLTARITVTRKSCASLESKDSKSEVFGFL